MYSPTFPGSHTLTSRALMRLLSGRKFTHREFQRETSTYRLSSCIEQLRNRHHWIIESTEEEVVIGGRVKRLVKYVRYSLEPEILVLYRKEFGEKLDDFIKSVKRFENGTPQAANLGGDK